MKGLLLAGGNGSRLGPLSKSVSKHLLPIYDKPLIYYPLTTLILAGCRHIRIVVKNQDLTAYEALLGNGNDFGLELSYWIQPQPLGIADALARQEDWIDQPVALALGDNIFHGAGLGSNLKEIADNFSGGAQIFVKSVHDARNYGVVNYAFGKPDKIIEKPKEVDPQAKAITGLYFLDAKASEFAQMMKFSERGELEITDVLNEYLLLNALEVSDLGRGTTWMDAGNPEKLASASVLIKELQFREGKMIGSPHEAAYHMGLIGREDIEAAIDQFKSSSYGSSLKYLASRPSQ